MSRIEDWQAAATLNISCENQVAAYGKITRSATRATRVRCLTTRTSFDTLVTPGGGRLLQRGSPPPPPLTDPAGCSVFCHGCDSRRLHRVGPHGGWLLGRKESRCSHGLTRCCVPCGASTQIGCGTGEGARRGSEAVDATHGSRYKLRLNRLRSSQVIPAFAGRATICRRFCHPSSSARWF